MLDNTPLLHSIHTPADLRKLPEEVLTRVANELRSETVEAVSQTGGHLGAGLGVVELTVALHYVFNTPEDRLVWDVGHQAYPHKILTGRREQIHTLRQPGGLYGFTKRSESEYDPFGAAHSSTAVSAAYGMAVARDLKGEHRHVIAVVGDGAMSAGMAFEGLNNAGAASRRFIIVLNDNNMSIAPACGSLCHYLNSLVGRQLGESFALLEARVAARFPDVHAQMRARATSKLRDLVGPENTLFDNLGLDYVGPVDGHKMDHLLAILKAARSYPQERPLLLHIVTRKGHGYAPAEAAADCYHGVNKFDVKSGEQKKSTGKPPSYTSVFARALIAEAERDPKIVGITAAMPSGTGIDAFSERFPDRSFDVAIAEQHAVTFAAGMAAEGMRPFCAIYSTFLQRAYDQVVHDVALQNLPVRFAMDRAGLVGADGPTHAGSFDIAYLGCLPNFVLMAPSDEVELMHMVATAARYDDGPIALRYPRGEGLGLKLPNLGTPLQLGRGRILREGSRIALLSFGGRLQEAMKAAELLALRGLSVTLADARFAKPLDRDLILNLSRNHEFIVTLEEGSRGGFATQVFHLLSDENLLDGRVRLKAMTLPDRFVAHGTPDGMYEDAGLAAGHIVAAVGDLVGRDKGPAREVVSLTRNASA